MLPGTEMESGSVAEVTGVSQARRSEISGAWVDFAEAQGFKQVVLVGHSAGWAAVRSYQLEKKDSRVVGVVLASGAVRAETRPTDADQLAEAKRLMAAGEGDALIRDPKRDFPSYVSAATFLDIANATAGNQRLLRRADTNTESRHYAHQLSTACVFRDQGRCGK